MTNAEIILRESIELMKDGIIGGSGIKGTTPDGKEIELPESIHTYAGWKSLGYQVKKGEHAIAKFPIWKYLKNKKGKNKAEVDEEKIESGRCIQVTGAFFTAGQVEAIQKAEVA